jgi:hypothetical protein
LGQGGTNCSLLLNAISIESFQKRRSEKEDRAMRMLGSRKAMVLLIPTLFFGFGGQVRSHAAEPTAVIKAEVVAPTNASGSSILGAMGALLRGSDANTPPPRSNCKGRLYSQHDVVGDPEACFLGKYSVGNGATSAAGFR